MGSLIVPPGYGQVLIPFKHSAFARAAVVTFGVKLAGVPSVSDCNTLLDTWDNALGAHIDDSVTMGPLECRVGQDGGSTLPVIGTATEVGSQAGSGAINQGQALLVKKLTGVGGRRHAGRMYIPWIVQEGNVDDVGAVASASLTTYNTALATWHAAATAIAVFEELVVLHSTGETEVPTPTTIVSLICDPVIGVQRRRLGR